MLQEHGFEMSHIPSKVEFSSESLGYDNLIFIFFCITSGLVIASVTALLERVVGLVLGISR